MGKKSAKKPISKTETPTDAPRNSKALTLSKSEIKSVGLASAPKGLKKAEIRKARKEKFLQNIAAEVEKKKGKLKENVNQNTKESKKQREIQTLNSLSDLLVPLKDTLQIKRSNNRKLTTKQRQKINKVELEQFKSVLEHPAFQKDPLAIITEHITNSVALIQQKQTEARVEQRKVEKDIEKVEKKKRKKEEEAAAPKLTKDLRLPSNKKSKKRQKKKKTQNASSNMELENLLAAMRVLPRRVLNPYYGSTIVAEHIVCFVRGVKFLVFILGICRSERSRKFRNDRTMEDAQGLIVTTINPETVQLINHFTQQVLSYGKEVDCICKNVRKDPKCTILNALAAICYLGAESYHHLSSTDVLNRAKKYIELARNSASEATEREQLYLQVAQQLLCGQKTGAIQTYELIIHKWPKDILAAKLLQEQYFNRGESEKLMNVGQHIFPYNNNNHYVYGMLAFGLVECDRYNEAEMLARQGTKMAPNYQDPWCHHSVAHCMEMTGRLDEGIEFMERYSDTWKDCMSFMITHNWWHTSLFYLEKNEIDHVVELYDNRVWGVCKESAQDQINAVSLLWRLNLREESPSLLSRWEDVCDYITPHIKEHVQPFLDIHYIYALAQCGRTERVEEMLESMEHTAKYQSGQLEIALHAAKALVAHAKGEYELSYRESRPIFPKIREIGGSNAQRDVYTQTYIDTLLKTHRHAEVKPLLEDRATCRPNSIKVARDLQSVYRALQLYQ